MRGHVLIKFFIIIYILESGGEGLHNSGFVAIKAVNEVFPVCV
jgi:hypothetical protein